MSRIGQKPISVLDGVKVSINNQTVSVEGPKGKHPPLKYRPEVTVTFDEAQKQICVSRNNDDRASRSYHGLTRSLINNMVIGVKDGYEKRLEIVGVATSVLSKANNCSFASVLPTKSMSKFPLSLM